MWLQRGIHSSCMAMGTILVLVCLLYVQVSMENSINPRITTGQRADPGQFLFIASIQIIRPPKTYYIHICAGTVIDKKWVLSTAICVILTKESSTARVKVNMYYTEEEDDAVQTIEIAGRFPHEEFDKTKKPYVKDIGLLELAEAAKSPVIAAELNEPRSPVSRDLWMLGWGSFSESKNLKPYALQYAHVRLYDNNKCDDHLPDEIKDSHICSYTLRRPTTACYGDEGGPLVSYENGSNKPELIGIISFYFEPCGQYNAPTISTRVSFFMTWIIEKMGRQPNKMSDNDLRTPLLAPH